jgi:hypothetical protein
MFGIMTTLNSVVAVVSGVVGEWLVQATGTKVAPFMAAVGCLVVAGGLIHRNWVTLLPFPSVLYPHPTYEMINSIALKKTTV